MLGSVTAALATWHAIRGDEERTYKALWSAQDLGLDDTVDVEVAFYLAVVFGRADQLGWDRPLRIAGKLAASQWDRLGRAEERDQTLTRLARPEATLG